MIGELHEKPTGTDDSIDNENWGREEELRREVKVAFLKDKVNKTFKH